MNIELKQRLVGAVVLVALAVIFIPMLLPGGGELGGGIDGSNIPPEPDYRFSPPVSAPVAPPMAASPILPADEVIEQPAAALEKPKVADKPKAAIKPVPVKKTVASKKSPAVAAKPVAQKSSKASGWVVQVGSFSSRKNAQALRDKLRKQGYATFVEPLKGKSGTTYRVRVGPNVSRKSSEQLRQKLAEVAGLKGLVQAYP